MVSTMTLRFGSSVRTRNTFSPPMTSSRFTTTSRCSSTNAWMRAGSRDTSVGAAKRANSAIASFSLWSRIASGALKTRAPSRTAAERSQVLVTYSRSNGGSLRINVALKLLRGRASVSCARYQSSSSSVSERRWASAAACPCAHCRLCCSHTQTPWPRFCAARIIATLVSLYALSVSGASMTKRRSNPRLLALRGHELDGGADFAFAERRVAGLGRHRALALDHRLHQRVGALLEARRPGVLVAELRRAGDRLRVAREADFVVDRFTVPRRGRFGLRLRGGRLLLGRGCSELFLELRAGLVRDQHHGVVDLGLGERRVARLRRHRALALDHRLHECVHAGLDARRPCRGVAELRRVRCAGLVAGRAGVLHDVGRAARARRAAGAADLETRDRLQSRAHRFRRHRLGVGARTAGHE